MPSVHAFSRNGNGSSFFEVSKTSDVHESPSLQRAPRDYNFDDLLSSTSTFNMFTKLALLTMGSALTQATDVYFVENSKVAPGDTYLWKVDTEAKTAKKLVALDNTGVIDVVSGAAVCGNRCAGVLIAAMTSCLVIMNCLANAQLVCAV